MTRAFLLPMVLLAACNGGREAESRDLAQSAADLASFIDRDLAPPAPLGCRGYLACYTSCFYNEPNPSDSKCTTQCNAVSKPNARALFESATACTTNWCLYGGSFLMLPYKCANNNGALTNVDGTPPSAGTPCRVCLDDAQAALYGSTCSDGQSPDCAPASCTAAVDACRNDLP